MSARLENRPHAFNQHWKRGGVWMCKLGLPVGVNTNIDKQVVCRWI